MPVKPLSDTELAELQRLLDALPAPLEPMDASALDGFLAGVLLQPVPLAVGAWLPHVHDVDARPLPPGLAPERVQRLYGLAKRRHAELDDAIANRDWFDPWVWELDGDASPSETVMPWAAGFATAMALFPGLMQAPQTDTLEPLATLFAHLDPDDLEDADALIAEIDTLEPPADLTEAVDGLVRSCLQLADVSRPLDETKKGAAARAKPPRPARPPAKGPARRRQP